MTRESCDEINSRNTAINGCDLGAALEYGY